MWTRVKSLGGLGLLAALLPAQVVAQENPTQVQVVGIENRYLSYVARKHSVSTNRIVQARIALRAVSSEIVDSQQLPRAYDLDSASRFWLGIDRNRASQELGEFLKNLADRAASSDRPDYPSATRSAFGVAARMAEVDPDRASGIIQAWPAPSQTAGEAAQELYARIQQAFQDPAFIEQLKSNPSSAIESLGLSKFDRRMNRLEGRPPDERRRLADLIVADLLEEYSKGPWDRGRIGEYLSRVRQIGQERAEAMPDLLAILGDAIEQDEGRDDGYQIVTVNNLGQATVRDLTEAVLSHLMPLMLGHSEAVMSWMDTMPELRKRFELRAARRRSQGRDRARAAAVVRPNPSKPLQEDRFGPRTVDRLGRAILSKPLQVKQALVRISESEDGFRKLLHIAETANFSPSGADAAPFPELTWQALEVARGLLTESESLLQRLARLESYLRIYRSVEGELDSDLLKKGFSLLDDLRDAGAVGSHNGIGPRLGARIDEFESVLIGESALQDVQAALRNARKIEEEPRRIRAMLKIIQSLTTN